MAMLVLRTARLCPSAAPWRHVGAQDAHHRACCPPPRLAQRGRQRALTTRASTSAEPPGGYGTISRSGLMEAWPMAALQQRPARRRRGGDGFIVDLLGPGSPATAETIPDHHRTARCDAWPRHCKCGPRSGLPPSNLAADVERTQWRHGTGWTSPGFPSRRRSCAGCQGSLRVCFCRGR